MSRVTLHRPARAWPPPVPVDPVVLPSVPQDNGTGFQGSLMTLLLPVMSSVALAAYMVSNGRPTLVIVGVAFVVCSLGAGGGMAYRMRSNRRRTRDRQRARYIDHLEQVRHAARQVAAAQRLAGAWVYPSPVRLWSIARARLRVWERRPSDPDFLHVRFGRGRGPLAVPVQMTRQDPLTEYDVEILAAAQRHAQRLGTVGLMPAVVDVAAAGVVSLVGPPERVRALARAVLCQVTVLHAPGDVSVAVCTGGEPSWEWVKWLPHVQEPHAVDVAGAGVVVMVAEDMADLEDVLAAEVDRARAARVARRPGSPGPSRRLIVVLDSYDPGAAWTQLQVVTDLLVEAGPRAGITVLCLAAEVAAEPTRTQVRARVDERGALALEGPAAGVAGELSDLVADAMAAGMAEEVARLLAPLRVSDDPDRVLSQVVSLADMLGVADLAAFDPPDLWRSAGEESMLRVPLGVGAEGPVLLDLKESALGGVGPHGLVVGATGSGKSELLRTLVSALAMTHSPELLSLVLVDFKGGATFAGLTELPHVAGLITNLADDLSLVERVRAALHGEQQRRQKLLRLAGNADSLSDYQLRRAAGATGPDGRPLEALPYLLVVVDEFGELLAQRNDFIELFVQIGRVGRSLGMHLLLATQRLEEGRLRGLESHLSYRICLRTFTSGESRAVIGTADAFALPAVPGSAFLKVADGELVRFRAACMSVPYEPPGAAANGDMVVGFGLRRAGQSGEAAVAAAAGEAAGRRAVGVGGLTALAVAADRLEGSGQPVHQVWLPPLPAVIPLDVLAGPVSAAAARGWQATLWAGGRLAFPVGLVDLPFQQRQEPLVLDLATHGNVVVVGAPQSGKSTLVRTVLLSAMLTHTPEEIRFYGLDFGGGTLAALAGAPHTGTIAGRREPELAGRVLAEMMRLVTFREHMFARLGLESPAAFRAAAAAGRLEQGVFGGEVVLVVDGWAAIRGDLEEADAMVSELAFRGLGVGVHVLLTASRWADVRMNVRDGFGTRLELRLNDPSESEVARPLARQVPAGVPGRGITAPGRVFHALAPRLDGRDTVDGLTAALDDAVSKIAAAWSGPAAEPVRLLPEHVPAASLPASAGTGLVIGLGDTDLQPVRLDLHEDDPHLLVIGDAGAGKSMLLRTLVGALATAMTPAQARLLIVDYRRSLLGTVPEEFVGAYAGDPEGARQYAAHLAAQLAGRLPPAGVTPAQLARRDWWEGPDFYVIVDDYDLVATTYPTPLAPLADFIPHARETGLHIILARRTTGVARIPPADLLYARTRDLGTSAILLSGDPREGVIHAGQRAAIRPPGRGQLLTRMHPPTIVQIAITESG
jgi:DNA segregation ATPase FtsK/SpoIIIE, S-DNA-T family